MYKHLFLISKKKGKYKILPLHYYSISVTVISTSLVSVAVPFVAVTVTVVVPTLRGVITPVSLTVATSVAAPSAIA
jgi:hypothetical protein